MWGGLSYDGIFLGDTSSNQADGEGGEGGRYDSPNCCEYNLLYSHR